MPLHNHRNHLMFSPEEQALARLHQTVMRLQEIAASQEPLTIKRERAAVNLCSLLQEIAATSTPALQAEVTRLIALYMDLR